MSKPAVRQTVKVALDEVGRSVGTLTYSKDGANASSRRLLTTLVG